MQRKATVLKKQRQEARKRSYNRSEKNKVKIAVKGVKKSVLAQDDKSADLLKKANKSIDKAAAKGIIHKNTAARKKSRLAKFKNKFGAKTS
jgi:small subunit ribosomal protein S20